jgi:hypothetical protein
MHARRLWDVRSGATLMVVRGNLGYVKSVAMSGDCQTLAVAVLQNRVRVLDRVGAPKFLLVGHTDVVSTVTVTADGQR